MDTRATHPRRFLTADEQSAVQSAIEACEKASSAELKVVLARHCWGDLRRKARRVFMRLHLDRTAERNCVLVLLVVTNRQFLIYGDDGIHRKVGQGFWDDIRDVMMQHFRNNDFGAGLCAGIERIGEKLATFFPHAADDSDEISNAIGYA